MAGSVAIAAESIDAAVAHVDEAKRENVNLIKLMITGGVLDAKEKGVPGELKMAPEMVKAVCNRAHALGYQVAEMCIRDSLCIPVRISAAAGSQAGWYRTATFFR